LNKRIHNDRTVSKMRRRAFQQMEKIGKDPWSSIVNGVHCYGKLSSSHRVLSASKITYESIVISRMAVNIDKEELDRRSSFFDFVHNFVDDRMTSFFSADRRWMGRHRHGGRRLEYILQSEHRTRR
jgi:hypothetical protein